MNNPYRQEAPEMPDDRKLMHELYGDVLKRVMPLITSGARRLSHRLSGHIHEEDAVQAGRIVVWNLLERFSVNECNGDLERFVQRCLRNAFITMYSRAVAKRRMPQAISRDGARYSTRPLPPLPTSMCEGVWENRLTASPLFNPERMLQHEDDERELELNLQEIRASLNDVQRFVLDTMLNPSDDLMERSVAMGGDPNGPPMQRALVEWMSPLLSKNQIDNALLMIRRAIIAHCQCGQFSDAFARRVTEGWHPTGANKKYCKPGAKKTRTLKSHDQVA